jgi:hypothetical protein
VPGAAASTALPGEVQVNSVAGIFEAGWSQIPVASVLVTAASYTFFVANRACRVKAVSIICSSAATVPTLAFSKETGTMAPGGGTNILAAATTAFSATANTRVVPGLSATIATLTLAAGDRLSFTVGGVVGAMVNGSISVLIVPV